MPSAFLRTVKRPAPPGAGRRPRRGAALLTTVLLVTAAATMSSVLVRQSLSLARAEQERSQADTARQCVDELQQRFEAELAFAPSAVLGASTVGSLDLDGARVTSDSGAVISQGRSPSLLAGQSSCQDGFNAAQHRVSLSLPSLSRPTLQVLLAAQQGEARYGRVVEYQLDSVSAFQVWSQELLDVERLFSLGPEQTEDGGGVAQPELTGDNDPLGAGLVGLTIPSVSQTIGPQLSDMTDMEVVFSSPGGRRYKITSVIYPLAATPGEVVAHQIVRSGVPVQAGLAALANDVNVFSHELVVIDTPPAGRVSYRTRVRLADSFGTNYSQGAFRPFLMVEDVGPAALDAPGRTPPAEGALGLVAVGPDRASNTFLQPSPAQLSPILGADRPAQAGAAGEVKVTFTPQPGRLYKVVSQQQPWAPDVPGALFTHTIARQEGEGAASALRSAMIAAPNGENAVSHLLEAVDAGPFAPGETVTYSARLSVAGGETAFNYADAVHLPFIAVFDVGPAVPAAVLGDGPAGIVAVSSSAPAAQVGAEATAVAQLDVVADGTRMLRVVSSAQLASALPGDVAVHTLARDGVTARASLVATDNDVNPVSQRLVLFETPPPGELSYQMRLRFSDENSGQGLSLSQGSFTPLLYVEDLGRIGANTAGDATVLAGAIYGSDGVRIPTLTANVSLGRASASQDSSPRHLQVISPARNPGPSFQPNMSVYTDVGADTRMPASTGAPGAIVQRGQERLAGSGDPARRDAVGLWQPPSAPSMRLDAAQLVGQTADRIELACDRMLPESLCLQPGQLLLPGVDRADRPLGVVGYATPPQGANVKIGAQLQDVSGQEVSFISDGTRMYQITSLINPLSQQPGETLAHRISRNGVDIQGGLHALENTQNAFGHVLVAFDVPPAGLVTYRTRGRFAADPEGVNLSSAGATPFLMVEDLGPAQGTISPADGAAGLRTLATPAVSTSGYGTSPRAVPGQQVTFLAEPGRRYAIVSSVRPLSSLAGNVAVHEVRRSSASGAVQVASGRVGMVNTVNISTHTLWTVVEPEAGPQTYTTFLSFVAGDSAQNLAYSDSVHRPLLAVLDLGPAQQLPAELLSQFPAGLVAPASSAGQVSFVAGEQRLYRVDFSAQLTSQLPSDTVRVDLVRLLAGEETVVQRGIVPVSQASVPADRVFSVLDAPAVPAGTPISYELRPMFSATPSQRTLVTQLAVVDAGRSAGGSGAAGADGESVGVVGSGSPFPLPQGALRASFASLESQPVSSTPTDVLGQQVSFEAAGGRRYKITSVLHPFSDGPREMVRHDIMRSAASAPPTTIQSGLHPLALPDAVDTTTLVVYDSPPPGRVTYSTRAQFAQSGSLLSSGSSRAYILVEDVGAAAEGVVPTAGAAGLVGRVAYATQASSGQVFASEWLDVPGQRVSFEADASRRYLLVSSIRPQAAPDAGLGAPLVAGHRVVRTLGGQQTVVAEYLVDMPNATSVFEHTFDFADTPPVSGQVSYSTQMRFFSGAGRNFSSDSFRPFLAVQDVGPVALSGPAPSEPFGLWPEPQAQTLQVSSPLEPGQLDAVASSPLLPGGRLYRVAVNLHPAFMEGAGPGGPPAVYRLELLRDGVLVQEASGYLAAGGTVFSKRIEVVDAPVAADAQVTYTARLTFPPGDGFALAQAPYSPQLLVEDLGPARPSTPFGFSPATAPEQLVGAAAPTLLTRVPDDAVSYRVEFLPDDAGGSVMLIESCQTSACLVEDVTASLALPVPRAGLVVIPGHTYVSGRLDVPLTLIAGTLPSPADVVVDVEAQFSAPVQLVATDRMVLQVEDGSQRRRLDADLVALGLSSPAPHLVAGDLAWGSMLTVRGSVAASRVDLVESFEQSGPVRLEPRRHVDQAPWAVGFSSSWTRSGSSLPTGPELAEVFSR